MSDVPSRTQILSGGSRRRPPAARRLATWLDHRTGYSELVKLIADEPIPGGARWWYVFGAVLSFLLVLEATTGVLLAAYYAPSATTAWASTAFIQDTLTLGWFVRGLHSFGSSAMLVVAGLHLLQVVLFGAYRRRARPTGSWVSACSGCCCCSRCPGTACRGTNKVTGPSRSRPGSSARPRWSGTPFR